MAVGQDGHVSPPGYYGATAFAAQTVIEAHVRTGRRINSRKSNRTNSWCSGGVTTTCWLTVSLVALVCRFRVWAVGLLVTLTVCDGNRCR